MTERVENSFKLTARAFEQPSFNVNETSSNPFAMSDAEFISNYTSTVNQTTVLAKNENKAIRNNAMASFTLGKSSTLEKYNAMMRMAQRNSALLNK